ncbi:MAG: TolC family protein, partial [Saprospiraceae bacterium]|nr:TolC family protein [Saprospiraceae bacterium]
KVFSAKDRFHIGQIGMQIPLYRSALQSKVKAIKMMEDIHSERVAMETKSLQSASMIYLENRKNMMSSIDIFRSDQLTASEAAIQLIKQKYIAGDIDFMEFTILSNNFINARKDYVELLRAFHLNEINLKYLQK